MGTNSQTDIANRQDFEISFTSEFDTNQSAATIITPTAGKRLSVKGIYINAEAVSGDIRIYFPTSANTIMKSFAANTPCTGYVPLFVEGQRNEVIKMTSNLGADQNYFVLINYKEL